MALQEKISPFRAARCIGEFPERFLGAGLAPATINHLAILHCPVWTAKWSGDWASSFLVSSSRGWGAALIISKDTSGRKPLAIAVCKYLEERISLNF